MTNQDAIVNDIALTDADFDTDSYVEPQPTTATRGTGRKLPRLTGHALGDIDIEECDLVLAQRPPRNRVGELRPEFFPGKRFTLGEDGRKAKALYNMSGWFRSWVYLVHDITSLHQAFERVRTCADSDGEPGYIVSGDLDGSASPASAPRSKHATVTAAGQKKPRGLVDSKRWWLVLDMDKVPNQPGLDPRQGDASRQATIDFLRSLLPDELRYAACSWQLSSSCCVYGPEGLPLPVDQPPARLGAHMRFWLDTGLAESERRILLQRLSHYVRIQLEARGMEPMAGAGVDPATATYNQAVFVCASWEAGLQDPLPVRSGLASGTPEVLVGVLDGQMPALPAHVAAQRTPMTDAEKHAARERRTHERLLRDATRARAPAPRPAPAADVAPVAGVRFHRCPRSQGPQDRVLHMSRIGKLNDIVVLTNDRRTRLREWCYGVPVGMRRRTMLIVAGLLSHLVPVSEMPAAIAAYGEHLTSPEWMHEEWEATKQADHIIKKAQRAEAAERAGADGASMREDPWLERIIDLMQPTYDEMVRLRLSALRTDAARKEVSRRDKGALTAQERREIVATTSESATRPWEAMGVSEATYRRRKRVARQQAAVAATEPTTAMLTARGLADVLAYVRLTAEHAHAGALRQLTAGPLSAAADELEQRGHLDLHDRLYARAAAYHSVDMSHAATILRLLEDARSTKQDTIEVLRWVMTGAPGYLAWAFEHDNGERVHSVADLVQAADLHTTPADFLEAVAQAHRETPVTVPVSVYQEREMSGGGGADARLAGGGGCGLLASDVVPSAGRCCWQGEACYSLACYSLSGGERRHKGHVCTTRVVVTGAGGRWRMPTPTTTPLIYIPCYTDTGTVTGVSRKKSSTRSCKCLTV